MDLKSFASAISQIAEEKALPQEKVVEITEQALASAYKKEYGQKGQIIKAKLDPKSGKVNFWQVKIVVDDSMIYSEEEMEELKNKTEGEIEAEEAAREGEIKKVRFNPEKHIMAKEAKKIDKKAEPEAELIFPLEEKTDFGRIASQTAKQVVLQKIREAERIGIMSEYKSKEGDIISGIVQRIESGGLYLDIGKTLGYLPKEEQVRGEFYRSGQRLKVFVLKVEESPRGPFILLSRAYPKLISKLFELEVPEISAEQIEIKSIAREAGSRTKVSVASLAEGVDPIGAMVGQRGVRVSAVISELGGEKIDIVEYSDQTEKYIANALSPAKVIEVKVLPKNTALVLVPNDQLSLAIGRDGQNVRLAAKLTGWKIDVKSPEQMEEREAPEDLEEGEIEEKTEKQKEKKKPAMKEEKGQETGEYEAEDQKDGEK
ncbi:MAG: transcription termination factor NusA [Candidatus Paceibacterota bacterium]|jgi:N utilization substance protein A|nr:transcription termination factor NusA [Candidatus Paceibacterota bacterium]